MREFRIILAACLSTALLVVTLAAPVGAASKGKLAIVQGWTDRKVDVCVNGVEVASAMKFGKVVQRKLARGKKLVKVYKADRRTCKGKLLAKRYFKLAAGGDKTMVVGKWKSPRQVLVFDNTPARSYPQSEVPLVLRHAADTGSVTFHQHEGYPPEAPVAPPLTGASVPVFSRGVEAWGAYGTPVGGVLPWLTTWVSRWTEHHPGGFWWHYVLAGTDFRRPGGSPTEWVFIGSGGNFRLKVIEH